MNIPSIQKIKAQALSISNAVTESGLTDAEQQKYDEARKARRVFADRMDKRRAEIGCTGHPNCVCGKDALLASLAKMDADLVNLVINPLYYKRDAPKRDTHDMELRTRLAAREAKLKYLRARDRSPEI